MKYALTIIVFLTTFILHGCTSAQLSSYSDNTPKLIPQDFFNGTLKAHGIVKNRSGKVIRYFNADITAHWKNGVGTLDEKFIFNDGEIQYRTWTLTPKATSTSAFTATAGDVVGIGEGDFSGNALRLNYTLSVKYNDSTINLRVDDWMWLTDSKTLLNESTLTKYGFKVGSVQLVITKKE